MELTTPKSRTYYYECCNGRFRLNYYLSFEILETLANVSKIKPTVLEDFPDGYDLDCTEADFNDFYISYRYKHPYKAELLCQTFKSIFTSTKKWKKFKGAGWIPADFLESHIETVSNQLEETIISEDGGPRISSLPKKENFILLKSKSIKKSKKIASILTKLQIDSVDGKKYLDEQFQDRLRMLEDTVSPQVFFNKISKSNLL